MHRESNWTIPNLLTVFRILITPAFVVAFIDHHYMLAFWLFFIAGVTDGLDGFLARVLKQRSKLGALIDPLADKALLITAFITLGITGWLPNWLVILVVSRDVIILGGMALLHYLSVSITDKICPTWISKANTGAQLLLVFTVILFRAQGWGPGLIDDVIVGVVAMLTVASGIHYVVKGFALFPAGQE
jgi:cardiolipin synthase (CMP-forming)